MGSYCTNVKHGDYQLTTGCCVHIPSLSTTSIVDTFEGGKASYRNFGGKIKTQVKILSFFYKHMKKSCLRKYHKLEYAGKILQMQLGQNLFCKIFKKLHVHCSGQKVALLCLRYVDTWPNLLTLEFN